ncbi:N/A [soil metagenome]
MTTTSAEEHAGEASRSVDGDGARSRWALFGSTAALVAITDQLSKAWVDATFALAATGTVVPGYARPTPIVGDLVRIAKSYNDGGIFGLVGDSAPILGLISIVVVGFIVVFQARQGTQGGPLLSLTLGLLLGGAIGNMADRLRLGYVVDFVDMGIGDFRWYTFNVADAAISTAVVGLLAVSLLCDRLMGR